MDGRAKNCVPLLHWRRNNIVGGWQKFRKVMLLYNMIQKIWSCTLYVACAHFAVFPEIVFVSCKYVELGPQRDVYNV